MILYLALFFWKAISRRTYYSTGHAFIDDFSHFNGSLWKAEQNTYRCVDERRMPLSCAISDVGNIEFVNISLASNPYFNYRNGMNIWLQNDCEDQSYGSKCCPKSYPCTRFSTGQLTSRKTYSHGAFSFLTKPIPKQEKRSGMIQMDVFFVRHGVSMANHIRQLAVQKGSITLLSGESILAIQLETGCNTGNLPSGVTQADCDHFLTDAKLSPEGISQVNALYMNFGSWAKPSDAERYGMQPSAYDPRDALVVISPMRRAAMTTLSAFRDHVEELCIQVDFDFRELQYSLRYGIHPENKLASYPLALQQYFAQNGFKDPNVNFSEEIYEQIEGKVMDTWEDDGCPKDPNVFKKKMQHITSVAFAQGKKYVVIGTHGFTIKCINREFYMQQTGGMHDESNPFFKFGWHVIQNGAVERITWDLFHEAVVGSPKFTHKGWHVYATNQAVNWKMFNSQWPMPKILPPTANGMYGPDNQKEEDETLTDMPSQKMDTSVRTCLGLYGQPSYRHYYIEMSLCFYSDDPKEVHLAYIHGTDIRRSSVNLGFDASEILGFYSIQWTKHGVGWYANSRLLAYTNLNKDDKIPELRIEISNRPLNEDWSHYAPYSISKPLKLFQVEYDPMGSIPTPGMKDELIIVGKNSFLFSNSEKLALGVSIVMGLSLLRLISYGLGQCAKEKPPLGYHSLPDT